MHAQYNNKIAKPVLLCGVLRTLFASVPNPFYYPDSLDWCSTNLGNGSSFSPLVFMPRALEQAKDRDARLHWSRRHFRLKTEYAQYAGRGAVGYLPCSRSTAASRICSSIRRTAILGCFLCLFQAASFSPISRRASLGTGMTPDPTSRLVSPLVAVLIKAKGAKDTALATITG